MARVQLPSHDCKPEIMAGFTPTVFSEAHKGRALFIALNVTHAYTDLWLYLA